MEPLTVMVAPPGTEMLIVSVFVSGLSPIAGDASEIITDVVPDPTAVMRTESFVMLAVATVGLGGLVIVYGGVPPVSFADDVFPGLIVEELFAKLDVNPGVLFCGAVVSSFLHPATRRRTAERARQMLWNFMAAS